MSTHDTVADFLRTDVQDYAPRIADITQALAAGAHASFIGNGYELTLSPSHATLAHTSVDRPPVTLPLADFHAAFTAWVAGLAPK